MAVDVPVRDTFDYLPAGTLPPPGTRVLVPFGRGRRVGVVWAHADASALPAERLKPIAAVLDAAPLLPAGVRALIAQAAAYYHHPIGQAVFTALPALARAARALGARPTHLALTATGAATDPATLVRAPRQAALLRALTLAGGALALAALAARPGLGRAARELARRGLVTLVTPPSPLDPGPGTASVPPVLNRAQEAAVGAVAAALGGYAPFLLEGVTGSGKTEVYLRLIEAVAARGAQTLLLVPEISLTPQTVARLEARLPGRVAVLHSGLPDRARLAAWQAGAGGDAQVVLGTRSAVFVPLARPGLVVVDEEHDPSYKQQDGWRYHGRDLAVLRARIEGMPVVLGSATPSLESLAQVERGRYRRLELPERAAGAMPAVEVVDLRRSATRGPISPQLESAIAQTLAAGGQALLFLNRRGYAPVLLCHACGDAPSCARCDARLTLHRARARLVCHHCGHERPVPVACPACGSAQLLAVGAGTERVEAQLAARFPGHTVVRLDGDTTARRGALEAGIEAARSGGAGLLVGTQLLAKGHHFPQVALAAVLDADSGLYAADFRAPERLVQLIAQVAGRAGRADRPGRVLVQTHHPDHPLLATWRASGYAQAARLLAAQRAAQQLPPYGYLAVLRAHATDARAPFAFLRSAAACVPRGEVEVLGPLPAPMPRRAGRARAQLVLSATRRAPLHRALTAALAQIEALPLARRVRWSLDVDPEDLT